MKHLGIYVHVPFCVKKCRYCDFASWAGRENDMQRYVQAVADEMRRKADALGHPTADTVFFGGGTPTLLPAALLKQLCDAVKDSFQLAENAEWTSEMNPGTITNEKAAALFEGGVNRVSMGVQSASERLLKSIGRIHTAEDAVKAAEIVSAAGIKRLNADMMLALPGMSKKDAEDTARFVLGLGVKHISCYALIP